MKKILLLIVSASILSLQLVHAQPPRSEMGRPDEGLMQGLDMNHVETSFVVNVNAMNSETKDKLNRVASNYRSRNRGVLTNIGKAMFSGGMTAVVNVLGTEIVNLAKIRSRQKKAWEEMRLKECTFIDSLQSVKGQSDFYGTLSNYGPLDPTDMNFDGITLWANRDGQEVLKMVCHIDTARFDHMFLHSKFYLVLDTVVFYPYRSYLPNLKANRIEQPRKEGVSQDVIDYWRTISQFSYDEQQTPTINIKMDVYSSWINELVQVYQDVKLGSFSVNIPVPQNDVKDSVYFYSREAAIIAHRPTIDMEGECFVVPRSYMPVSANSPSWGTGEYKMKVVLSEKCRYNPKAGRSKNWHRDYKQLVRMQNHGKAKNEYVEELVTTFRDNGNTILKATYTPLLNQVGTFLGFGGTTGGAGGMSGGMPTGGAKPSAQGVQQQQMPANGQNAGTAFPAGGTPPTNLPGK